MKFQQFDDRFHNLDIDTGIVTVYNKKGEVIGTENIKDMRDTLINYCTIIQIFPWE